MALRRFQSTPELALIMPKTKENCGENRSSRELRFLRFEEIARIAGIAKIAKIVGLTGFFNSGDFGNPGNSGNLPLDYRPQISRTTSSVRRQSARLTS
jgi:hypothetical protein